MDAGALREAVMALPTHTRRNGFATPNVWVTRRDVLRLIERAALAAAREPVAPAEAEPPGLRAAAIEALESEALPANVYHRLRRALFPEHGNDNEACYCDECYSLLVEDAR